MHHAQKLSQLLVIEPLCRRLGAYNATKGSNGCGSAYKINSISKTILNQLPAATPSTLGIFDGSASWLCVKAGAANVWCAFAGAAKGLEMSLDDAVLVARSRCKFRFALCNLPKERRFTALASIICCWVSSSALLSDFWLITSAKYIIKVL